MTLPSGKTIEVVYFADEAFLAQPEAPNQPSAEPQQDLHVCTECESELVYPVQWEEAGPVNWSVVLHCPNCDVFREGVFTQDTSSSSTRSSTAAPTRSRATTSASMRANMADEIDRFVGALAAGAILPEDF